MCMRTETINTAYSYLYMIAPSVYATKVASSRRAIELLRLFKLSKITKGIKNKEISRIHNVPENKGGFFDYYDFFEYHA